MLMDTFEKLKEQDLTDAYIDEINTEKKVAICFGCCNAENINT